jgi:hypothetical protein
LQQGSQLLLQHEQDDDQPLPTSNSPLPPLRSNTKSSSARNGKADGSEKVVAGSTAPVVEVSRERFSYWCLDLLFLICSDTSKGRSQPSPAPLDIRLRDTSLVRS